MRDMRATLRDAFARVLPNRRRALRRGTLDRFPFNDRQITVYLPPGYAEGKRRYPVLYMQDGQNLFDDERAFAGHSWRLHLAADEAIGERTAAPMIIVGVDHTGAGRIEDYTPTRDAKRGAGGKAEAYRRMLLDEIKPLIDAAYRTTELASIGGSSLGGLVSLYLGLTTEAFAGVAAMSPSIWWDGRAILKIRPVHRPRIWLDIGGREGAEALRDARAARDWLRANGWTGKSLGYYEDRRGDHSERTWAKRARMMLEFLFPPGELHTPHGS
jgi:predicted alpha/beta superfamily hydrolase